MLTPFGQDLWIADGDMVSVAGFVYPTRMAVIRLKAGGLALWSPVTAPGVIEAVCALGEVRHIIAPNHLHHLALDRWARACPGALLHAAPRLRLKRPDLPFGTDLGSTAHPDWAGQLEQVVMYGNRITTEVVFFHRPSRTVLVTDLLQQFEPGFHSGWRAAVARLDRMTGPRPQMPRKFRLAFTNRNLARPAAQTLLAWPAERLVVAHGRPVPTGAADILRAEFGFLT